MNTLIIATTIVAMAAAAQLPSASYLPSSGSGPNSGSPGYAGSPSANQFDGNNRLEDNVNARPQQAIDRSAAIVRMANGADENGFQYAYETSNGIQAEEAGNAAQTQGGFSYKGDDGQVYSIRFTAGEGGFRPEGAHLPVPPPTPVEILLALKQNEQDEAAGIFDDGLYHPEKTGNTDNAVQSGGRGIGSGNHQGSFDTNSGYRY